MFNLKIEDLAIKIRTCLKILPQNTTFSKNIDFIDI